MLGRARRRRTVGPPDPDDVARFAHRVWSYKQWEVVSLLIHLGDRLELYRALDGAGAVSAEELAASTGLRARWLHEWLRDNAAAALLASEDGDRFELTAAGALVLTREEGRTRQRGDHGQASRGPARPWRIQPGTHFRLSARHDKTRRGSGGHPAHHRRGRTWLVKEVRCDDTWAGDRRNPMLAMFFGFSIVSSMSSALSEPDGAGLGTLGLPPRASERLARDAGFTRFRMHDFEEPANLYYEIRP
jgi:Rv2258c-like winged HTH domain